MKGIYLECDFCQKINTTKEEQQYEICAECCKTIDWKAQGDDQDEMIGD